MKTPLSRPSLPQYFLRWIPAAGWALLVAWLSLASNPPRLEGTLISWDKFQHGAAYALLCLLTGFGLLPLFRRPAGAWLAAALLAILFGGGLEVAQAAFTAGRLPEWADLLADAIGAGLAAALAWWGMRRGGER